MEDAATKLFVGNIPWGLSADGLAKPFAHHGTVIECEVVRDHETGHSRGFGFVSMATPEEAKRAIQALHGDAIDGRVVTVQVAFRAGARAAS